MAQLQEAIENIYDALENENSVAVHKEFENDPLPLREDIFICAGVSKVIIENGLYATAGKYYDVRYILNIRIIGQPNTMLYSMYRTFDVNVLSKLSEAGYDIIHAETSAPFQDYKIRRFVLECSVELSGKAVSV